VLVPLSLPQVLLTRRRAASARRAPRALQGPMKAENGRRSGRCGAQRSSLTSDRDDHRDSVNPTQGCCVL